MEYPSLYTLCLTPELLYGFKGAVNRQSLVVSISLFFSFRGVDACGVAKAIYGQFCFPTWARASTFNNNNNIGK